LILLLLVLYVVAPYFSLSRANEYADIKVIAVGIKERKLHASHLVVDRRHATVSG
jgi:hypothetical protein